MGLRKNYMTESDSILSSGSFMGISVVKNMKKGRLKINEFTLKKE